MEWIVGESHRHGSYSGESRSIQLYPACLLWCLWLKEWRMIQTTYSLGPGSLGGQKREEIMDPAQHTCSVPPAPFFTDCTGNRYLAALGTMWFHMLVPFLILNAVVWACVWMHLAVSTMCLCLPHHFWTGPDDVVYALPTSVRQSQDNLHLAWRDQLWRWICLK